jgi:hypothetical protein
MLEEDHSVPYPALDGLYNNGKLLLGEIPHWKFNVLGRIEQLWHRKAVLHFVPVDLRGVEGQRYQAAVLRAAAQGQF